ncbi:hypothetical protein [Clostridium botulinum]|uniref:hypothetical protein n=1 Tax=Clostridium botulinum TaxID=1491 RepID=UPI00036E49BD|nr:hypothetical protein [Clostridium botulinum]
MLQHTNFGIVINEKIGYKIDFVVVEEHELKDGEKVIEKDWNIANAMLKPKWTGEEWVEGATEEEIKEHEEENKPKPKEPTEVEILKQQLLETQAIVAELRYKIILKENGGM